MLCFSTSGFIPPLTLRQTWSHTSQLFRHALDAAAAHLVSGRNRAAGGETPADNLLPPPCLPPTPLLSSDCASVTLNCACEMFIQRMRTLWGRMNTVCKVFVYVPSVACSNNLPHLFRASQGLQDSWLVAKKASVFLVSRFACLYMAQPRNQTSFSTAVHW